MRNTNDFIRFLGQLVFDPENNDWHLLTPQQKEEYCLRAQKSHMLSTLFVRFLKDDLPEPFRHGFRNDFQTAAVQRLIENTFLNDLYHFFESEKIAFVPVKGADLAFRIYPDPALRPHEDWDILFRKEDGPRVLDLLQKRGWQTFSGYSPDRMPSPQHYERMYNGHQVIEVHWSLPNFKSAGNDAILKETEAINEYHRILTPEMNLLLISAHAMCGYYTHSSVWKILMDAGFILKHDAVDWSKVHRLADRWGILRPDILFGAWSEFFPEGVLPSESLNPDSQQLIRETFEMRKQVKSASSYECRMAMGRRDLRWVLSMFKFYHPLLICKKYHLPAHQNGLIFLYGVKDFIGKVFYFLVHFKQRNSGLQRYFQNVEQINRLVR